MTATPAQAACLSARLAHAEAERTLEAAAVYVMTARTTGTGIAEAERHLTQAAEALRLAESRLTDARLAALAAGDGVSGLDARFPLLLLPVRLETRYRPARNSLLVRIYPDDVHADGHEPALTAREGVWRTDFLTALARGRDRQDFLEAWTTLARRAGPERALWLATANDAEVAGGRPSAWSRAARARLLPDRFVAFAWTDRTDTPIRADATALVREPLALGSDPMEAGPVDEAAPAGAAARWLHDFEEARGAGMALEIPLPDPAATVRRLLVVGVRSTVDTEEQAHELERLLTAHRCTTGLDILAPGTPTNALPGLRTPYRFRPDLEALYDDELQYEIRAGRTQRRLPHHMSRSPTGQIQIDRRAVNFELARVLGIDPAVIGYAAGSDDTSLLQERDLIDVLAAAFRPEVERQLAPSVGADAVAAAFDHLSFGVSASGPLAAFRLGSQPYGILPVHISDRGLLGAADAALLGLLDALRRLVFEPAVAGVPRVGMTGGDADRAVFDMLRSDAVPRQLRVRLMIDVALLDPIRGFLPAPIVQALDSARAGVVNLLQALGDPTPGATTIGRMALFPDAGRVTRPLVAASDAAAGELPGSYLAMLAGLPVMDVLAEAYPGGRPRAVLFDLIRLALLRAADSAARAWLVSTGVNPAEFDNPARPLGTVVQRLGAPAPDDPARTIGQRLADQNAPEPDLLQVQATVRRLAGMRPDRLEILFGGVLSLFSHRLDAWYTGYAVRRLNGFRNNAVPNTPALNGFPVGLAVGAYGWLEQIPRAGGQQGLGFIHAPSAQHAGTAAVLLSAFRAHTNAAHGDAFAIDLSSRRVREAVDLLEGMRAGQPLGALLGYRIERTLVEAGGTAPALIAQLRAVAPLIANKRIPSASPAENVAADNVVDGLVLLRLAGYDGNAAPTVETLAPRLQGSIGVADAQALETALDRAAAEVDAVSDLLLAESVYHLVGGSAARTGAAVDATSGAPTSPPQNLEIARTPRRGIATTHRVMVLLDPAAPRAPGWDATPRAEADPAVDAWAGSLLPPPSSIRLRVRFGDSGDAPVTTLDALLSAARAAPREDLMLGAIDVMLAGDPAGPNGGAWLASRLAALAELIRPAGVIGNVRLFTDRDATWPASTWSIDEVVEIARAMRAAVGGARLLTPRDVGPPGAPAPGTVDQADLTNRVAAARLRLQDAEQALTAVTDDASRRRALRKAELVMLLVAPDGGDLALQVAGALAEAERRLHEASAPSLDDQSRMRALLGRDLPAVERLLLPNDAIRDSFAVQIGATDEEVRAFIARAAAVREPVLRIETLLAYAEAVALSGGRTDAPMAYSVAQEPRAAAGDRWTALPQIFPAGRTSFIAIHPRGTAVGAQRVLAGFLLDEWNEVVPAPEADTSVAFNYGAPSAEAPNAWLLLVPETNTDRWSAEALRDHVMEAMALAKLRVVDPDLLTAVGQLLPALLAPDGDFGPSLAERLTRPEQP